MIRAAERTLPAMPTAVSVPLAVFTGTLAYLSSPAARSAVRANLDVVAPERATDALVRRVFIEQARNYLEVFRVPRTDHARLRAMVTTRGWEHFTTAHARGKGVIVASAHIGPISVVGQILVANGYPVVLPVESEHSEFQRAVNRARGSMGMQLVYPERPLAVYRALRERKVFGLLADRAVTGVGERVPFFGRPALLPSVHVALALRTGAPVVPAFSTREGDVMYASFEPPLELEATGDHEADMRAGMLLWSAVLERYVRRYVEQWTVFDRFWDR
ncbi:MAG TPA: lysophospholipid acyltransferase family protein [Candidatus Limnocylindria bacterium]